MSEWCVPANCLQLVHQQHHGNSYHVLHVQQLQLPVLYRTVLAQNLTVRAEGQQGGTMQ